jgi:hypothetical protein
MTTAYRVLAFAIAAMVAIQVGAVGYAVFAQLNWIEKGGTVDEAAFATGVPGTGAYMFHALFAGVVLLASLAMLVTSFFAKIPQGVMWAVIVLVCTVVQIALGTLSHMLAAIGVVHGAVALVLFGVAVMAAMRARRPAAVEEPVPAEVLQRPTTPIMAGRSTRVRLVVAAIDTLAVLAPLAWLWQSSLVGKSYSVMVWVTSTTGVGRSAVITTAHQLARSAISWSIPPARPTCASILWPSSRISLSAGAPCPATPSTAPRPAR